MASARNLRDILFSEQVSVRAGALKTNGVAVYAVNQYPIRFDMGVAARLPFPFQRMIAKLARKRFPDQS